MKKLGVVALMVVASALSGCEFAGNALLPSFTGQPARAPVPQAVIVPLDPSALGAPSGTSAGTRIAQFRPDLVQLQRAGGRQLLRGQQLQADMAGSIRGYWAALGVLQPAPLDGAGETAATGGSGDIPDAAESATDGTVAGGTESGDAGALSPTAVAAPLDRVAAWQQAQAQLRTLSATLDQMNGLAGEVAKNVAYSAYLRQSIRAAGTAPDAVEEDHRQLARLENATAQTSAALGQLLDSLRQDVLRQSHFLGTEGARLAQIAPPGAVADSGTMPPQSQLPPSSLSQLPPSSPSQLAGPAGSGLASGRPFVVIRFDDPGIQYEQRLYDAVSAALAQSPHVGFDLVGVAPAAGAPEDIARNSEAARASMERVRNSLLGMGLSADRVSITQLTESGIQSNEVRLYVR